MEQKIDESKPKRQIVSQIAFWLVKILVVVFFITGAATLFQAIFKTVAFEHYPLLDYQMTVYQDGKEVKKTDEQIAEARKLQMLGDYSGAITLLLLAGGFLWLSKKTED